MAHDKSDLQVVLQEISQLRSDLGLETTARATEHGPGCVKQSQQQLRIFFERVRVTGRKPYVLVLDGVFQGRINLSSTRAAIFVVLFLDLQSRLGSGQGVIDVTQKACEAYARLEGLDEVNESILNGIRAGFSRIPAFVDGLALLSSSWAKIAYDIEGRVLGVKKHDTGDCLDNLDIQVSATDSLLNQIINQNFASSPIAQLRTQKGMFLEANDTQHDVLFNELLDHNFPVQITSAHVRPLLINHPRELLENLGGSPLRLKRWDLAKTALQSGQLNCLEIFSREALWNLITYKEGNGYLFYPSVEDDALIGKLLGELIFRLKNYPNFNICLVDVPLPMVVSNFELKLPQGLESFTFMFQASQHTNADFPSVFVVNNAILAGSIRDTVFHTLFTHPTATTDRQEVINVIEEVRSHFREHGRLEYSE